MKDNIKAGGDIHAGDGGYSIGTQEKYDEFAKGRNQSLGKMRIRELAEQAGILKEQTVKAKIVKNEDGTWTSILEYPDLEKFAELIVQECAEVAQDFVTVENNKLVEHVRISPWHLQDKIKEHFGVEE